MQKRSSMPRDPNQRAKMIVDMATGEAEPEPTPKGPEKNPAAVALGKLGGAKGGKARAAKLTPQERSAIAKRAAAARWGSGSQS
ncbi:MAG: histone H1 [Candidatus Limnocylindrales bacterium]